MSTDVQPPAEADEAAAQTAATAAPEVIADSFGEYAKIWWTRVRSGDSGALPVILGLVAIVISHNLNDVQAVADRVAVLRLGQLVSVGPLSQYDAQSIVDLMTTGTSRRLAGAPAGPPSQQPPGSSSEH